MVHLPFPAVSGDDVVERVMAAATDRTRLAVLSHVTSPTALILPVERLVPALAERGIETLVDGAHAPGMVPLDLDRLGAAYYAANLHKWVCAPKGSGFLHTRRDRQAGVRPGTISHGANTPTVGRSRFRLEFDWQGTLDPTPWLAVPSALDFVAGLVDGGWPAVMARNRELALEAGQAISQVIGTEPSPAPMLGAMVALAMPAEGPLGGPASPEHVARLEEDRIQNALFDRHGIEVPIALWPVPAIESPDPPRRMLRVSMATYNDRDDVALLVAALRELSA